MHVRCPTSLLYTSATPTTASIARTPRQRPQVFTAMPTTKRFSWGPNLRYGELLCLLSRKTTVVTSTSDTVFTKSPRKTLRLVCARWSMFLQIFRVFLFYSFNGLARYPAQRDSSTTKTRTRRTSRISRISRISRTSRTSKTSSTAISIYTIGRNA